MLRGGAPPSRRHCHGPTSEACATEATDQTPVEVCPPFGIWLAAVRGGRETDLDGAFEH